MAGTSVEIWADGGWLHLKPQPHHQPFMPLSQLTFNLLLTNTYFFATPLLLPPPPPTPKLIKS